MSTGGSYKLLKLPAFPLLAAREAYPLLSLQHYAFACSQSLEWAHEAYFSFFAEAYLS